MENATRSPSANSEDRERGEEKWIRKEGDQKDEADGDDVISATVRHK